MGDPPRRGQRPTASACRWPAVRRIGWCCMGDERAVDRPKDARDAEYLSDTEGTGRGAGFNYPTESGH
jgi:hypothetical protein